MTMCLVLSALTSSPISLVAYTVNPTDLQCSKCTAQLNCARLACSSRSTPQPDIQLTWNKTIHTDKHINCHENVSVQVTSDEASRMTQDHYKSSGPKAENPVGSEQTYKTSTVDCVKTFDQLQEPFCIRHIGTIIMRNRHVVFSNTPYNSVTQTCRVILTNKSPQ